MGQNMKSICAIESKKESIYCRGFLHGTLGLSGHRGCP